MAEMKMSEIREEIKRQALAVLANAFESANAEKYAGDYRVAIPVSVGGTEYWCKVDLTAAQWYATRTAEAFDPFESQAAYEQEQAIKRDAAEQKRREREAKKASKARG